MKLNVLYMAIRGQWLPPKLLLVMKITMLILFAALMQVSAASFSQKITLTEKNAPLEKILNSIKQQSGYMFFYNKEDLKQSKAVDVDLKNASIQDALEQCFAGQSFSYKIFDNTIVIKKEESGLMKKVSDFFRQDSLVFKGTVIDSSGRVMPGASVRIKGKRKTTFTNKDGNFTISAAINDLLQITYVGYEVGEFKLRREDATVQLRLEMKPVTQELGEVAVVSTGYQDLPKERATGSFQTISAKQLQHSTDPNLLKRLEGITTGLDFNNNSFQLPTNSSKVRISPLSALTIRGKNNLQRAPSSDPNQVSGQPLVVIDGVASPYSIDKINPNDVESINILQDAAAASIWGSKAANGVIVVKTKKGSYNHPTSISFNANINVSDKMDLFYKKYMSTSDFIDAQIAQLDYNYSQDPVIIDDPTLDLPQIIISPVAEIWNAYKKNDDLKEYNRQLDLLRKNDARNDLTKYFLRNAVIQSYALGIDGGNDKYAYRLSGSYDQNRNNTIHSDGNRVSVNYNASVRPLKNLEFQAAIGYNQQNRNEQASGNTLTGALTGEGIYAYTRLVDDQGKPAIVPRGYRPAFLNLLTQQYGDKILDMTYKPLDDINQGYLKYKSQLINLNMNASYKINSMFSGTLTYNNAWGLDEQTELRGQNSYYMRELINKFTDPSTFERAIPLGGFYNPNLGKSNNQTLRGQLNANKTWAEKHVLSAIAGVDISQNYNEFRDNPSYGYDEKTKQVNNNLSYGVYKNMLFMDPYTQFPDDLIPTVPAGFSDFKLRTFSLYANAAYTYDKRYTLSASIRNDASNVFGYGTNKYGASYFSIGGSWSINNEKFYHLDWLPHLQLRATFGYNGNVNTTVSPVALIDYIPAPSAGNMLPYASTTVGVNRLLRPEKAAMTNLALSFGTRNNRLTGSLEYYIRKTTDLIATTSLDPSTGFSRLSYNTADLRGSGTDITLNSINLQYAKFSWNSSLLFSNNHVKVTGLYSDKPNTAAQRIYGTPAYNVGSNLSRLFAFRWAGLDPETGDPMGYVDGKPVRFTGDVDTFNAIADAPASTAHYFGSSVPVYFGAFRNTFNYGNLSVSVNFLYKLGYYFRRSLSDLVQYSNLYNSGVLLGAEYNQRWKKPGDEKTTNVPSLIFPVTGPGGATELRDYFYQYADVNVLKADHIRLQEINLSYSFRNISKVIKNPRIYANVTNLGIIWRANKLGIDPDINDYPQPKTYSLGLSASF